MSRALLSWSIAGALALAEAAVSQTSLELVDLTLGTSSGTGAAADLPRGHSVRLDVRGPAGAAVFIGVSVTPPPANPPVLGGQPLAIDPAAMLLLVDGALDPAARIGAGGTYAQPFVVPPWFDNGLRVWAQALTVSTAGQLALSRGLLLTVVDVFRFDFEDGLQGWQGGFADYPVGEEAFYELGWQHDVLPAPLDPSRAGFRIHGNNHSDDLLLFAKRRVGGLAPGAVYEVASAISLASQYPANSLGVGGSPGSGVVLKAGASTFEPAPVVDPLPPPPYYRINIDTGSQGQGGQHSAVLGHIGIPGDAFVYTLIERQSAAPIVCAADASGQLWLHFALDSGFEATTDVVFDDVVFVLRR